MTKLTPWLAAGGLALSATYATAGGLDRSGQNVGILFEKGNYAELSFARVMPSVSGADAAAFGGTSVSGIGKDYSQLGFGVKLELNDAVSIALYYDQPFGADVEYPATSVALGGTSAELSSHALNLMARYKFNENFSAHAGLRHESIDAEVSLAGVAYGGGTLFDATFDRDSGVGFAVGAAYERPEIAMRIALTYFSGIDYTFNTTTRTPALGTTTTDVSTPEAINLDFQTGVAQDTLLFGQIRHAKWSNVDMFPVGLGGSDLINLEDVTTYSIGVGRQFSEKFSGSISVSYEAASSNDLVSPLGPSNGRFGVSLGGRYKIDDNITLSGGINYTKLGDAVADTPAPGGAVELDGNDSVGIGFKIGYHF